LNNDVLDIGHQLQNNEIEEINMLSGLESRFNILYEGFLDAALYVVHYIVKKNLPGLNLLNLAGDGGEKFMAGGLSARRAKDWLICGKNLTDEMPMGGSTINVNQVVAKLATHNARALALLRFRIPNLLIPLSCVIDYYGIVFEV
jgi:hypothetical protein